MKSILLLISLFCFDLGISQEADSLSYFVVLNGKDTVDGNFSKIQIENGKFTEFQKSFYKIRSPERKLVTRNQQHSEQANSEWYDHIRPVVSGQFLNSRRKGLWVFYFPWSPIISHSIKYESDTIRYRNEFAHPDEKLIYYINDSNIVYGQTVTMKGRSIKFRCWAKQSCAFWYGEPRKVILESAYNELDFHLTRIEIGTYDRQISQFISNE